MRGSLAKLGYVMVLTAAILATTAFHVLGNTSPTAVQGPAAGLTGTKDITSTTSFSVPPGIGRLMVEAWGGGGGGGVSEQYPTCVTGGSGGGGGYLRTIIAVSPGESLRVVIGSGGAVGGAGSQTAVLRGSLTLVSAGGGGGASTTAGAGGAVTATGIVRAGNPGKDGQFDFMCAQAPGNPPAMASASGGAPVQGSVATLGGRSAGGRGEGLDYPTGLVPAEPGLPGEVVLTW